LKSPPLEPQKSKKRGERLRRGTGQNLREKRSGKDRASNKVSRAQDHPQPKENQKVGSS